MAFDKSLVPPAGDVSKRDLSAASQNRRAGQVCNAFDNVMSRRRHCDSGGTLGCAPSQHLNKGYGKWRSAVSQIGHTTDDRQNLFRRRFSRPRVLRSGLLRGSKRHLFSSGTCAVAAMRIIKGFPHHGSRLALHNAQMPRSGMQCARE